jgi:hypothetical protein
MHALQGGAAGGGTSNCSELGGSICSGGGGGGGGGVWSARLTDKFVSRTTPGARSLIGRQPHAGALAVRIGAAMAVSDICCNLTPAVPKQEMPACAAASHVRMDSPLNVMLCQGLQAKLPAILLSNHAHATEAQAKLVFLSIWCTTCLIRLLTTSSIDAVVTLSCSYKRVL